MKPSLFLLLVASAWSAGAAAAEGVSVPDGWRLSWHDEFDADGPPDPAHWGHELGFVRNREEQLYTDRPANARVEDGVLVIEARRETVENPAFDPDAGADAWREARREAAYTSAAVRTKGRHGIRYGRVAVRARLPEGRGIWPAIWLLADDYSRGPGGVGWPLCGEIDVMEFVGYLPGVVHTAVHTAERNHGDGTQAAAWALPGDVHRTFRVYAVEWFPDRIDFFVDGRRVQTFANDGGGPESWPFDKPFHLILNVAVGGSWGGRKGVDPAIFPQRMEVDWVRVYKAAK